MAKGFLSYDLEQRLLLPPDMRDWLPEGHLALFIADAVATLDLSKLYAAYETGDERGRAGFDPRMMLSVLLYAYCTGKPSSRKIERATYEDVAFRVLSGDRHPDHDCIAEFRRRHLALVSDLFAQVLQLCQKAGLVKLGHVALDGTKIGANASKHKAMSYGRMGEAEKKLESEIAALLAEAERVDGEEDEKHGKGKRGDELPRELQRRQARLEKLREAKAALDAEAKERAEKEAAEARAKLEERARKEEETGKKAMGRAPTVPNPDEAKPDDKAQRNFTDPESRIMPDGANKGSFVQAYNAQIAVDAEAQVIVAYDVTQQPNDKRQLAPMAEKIVENVGKLPETLSADAGYFSGEAVESPALSGTNLLIPPDRQRHGAHDAAAPADAAPIAPNITAKMRAKVRSAEGHALYRMRKAIVEPVFGQMKGARGLRRVLLRGLRKARDEFGLMALTHNLLKLWRSGRALPALPAAA